MKLPELKYDRAGVVPVAVQDADTGQLLMLAYMNEEALRATLRNGFATYWSRSRQKLWTKGETSGHKQKVVEIRADCDGDALLLRVVQEGGACHEGYRTCFFRRLENGELKVVEEQVFSPEQVYGD
jgi:phosphoribosyl-AMP cyclohydrolase